MKPGYAGIETNYSTDQNFNAFRRCEKVLQDLISEIKICKINPKKKENLQLI